MATRRFQQVDVFTEHPTAGNPVAVVLDAEGLTTEQMQQFAAWTNLSETTFVLPPTRPDADYRVRIFTPGVELPFAGHPTLGTCHAWLRGGGVPQDSEVVVQECGIGTVRLRRGDELSFAAPPMTRSDPDPATLARVVDALGVSAGALQGAHVLDNGIAWWVLVLPDAATVLELEPRFDALVDLPDVGVVGRYPDGDVAIEARAFAPGAGIREDPVTGSLQASVGQLLTSAGEELSGGYLASQGTRLGRAGRVRVSVADGQVWVGGGTHTVVEGTVAEPAVPGGA